MQEDNDHIYYLDQAPKGMIFKEVRLSEYWCNDIGPNQIKISVSDGIEHRQSFTLFVNDLTNYNKY